MAESFEQALSDKEDSQGLIVIVKPASPPEPGKLTYSQAELIFHEYVGDKVPRAEIEALTCQLNSPWAKDYTYGVWDFHTAIRVILEDAPVVLRAERGHLSQKARERERGYSLMLEGAKLLEQAGVRLPRPNDPPPKTNQAKSVANSDHRDWWHFYCVVRETLIKAKCRGIANKEGSPVIVITRNLLKVFNINSSEYALVQMIRRKNEEYGQKLKDHLRHARLKTGEK